jgi:hypothetical protein
MWILYLVRNLSIFCMGMYYGYSKFGVSTETWKWVSLIVILIITNLIISIKNGSIVITKQ